MLTDPLQFSCPWCGSTNDLEHDPGEAGQILIQDCSVCCSPIEIEVPAEADSAPRVRREGD
ncbi:MAG: CPXCG motif-containing cysteine-rich protein [Pseudomonadota bacterium]|nr:MAG: CPXCG motif-containing cysteine-rich protein [Pseudomonadota bacterium]